jgi:hypothetical protein
VPRGTFAQDLAVDERNGWIYLADIANPGIITIDLSTTDIRRLGQHPALQSENLDVVIDGKVTYSGGSPAPVAIDLTTLSSDSETLFLATGME